MADISMCMNKECKQKKQCYRFTATPNPYRQAYAAFEPVKVIDSDGKEVEVCNYFVDNS